MKASSERGEFPVSPSVRGAELFGRLVLAGSLAALLFALWAPRLELADAWVDKEIRILPRLSVFVAGALMTLIFQGARPRGALIFALGLIAALGAYCLLPEFSAADRLSPITRLAFGFTSPDGLQTITHQNSNGSMAVAGPCVDLMRFEFSLFAAILFGTWLGRDIKTGDHFVGLLLCAVVGDFWLSTFRVPESVDPTHPLSLLRIPWPPRVSYLGLSPSYIDILVLSAMIESARSQGFHLLSVLLGAVAGYCAASFLALEPWPAWPALSMALFSCGVLAGCWPDLKCDVHEAGKAFLLSAILLATLIGITSLQRKLHPLPEPQIDISRLHSVT